MINVTKKINLSQLDSELNGKGLIASLDENKEINAVGLADDNDATEGELEAAIKAHKANPIADPTIEEKLASVGLSVNDLKVALGI
jgi:hypothetical protein